MVPKTYEKSIVISKLYQHIGTKAETEKYYVVDLGAYLAAEDSDCLGGVDTVVAAIDEVDA